VSFEVHPLRAYETSHRAQNAGRGLSPQVSILGVDIDCLSIDGACAIVERWLGQPFPRARVVVTVNAEMLTMATSNRRLRTAMQKADLTTADGVGVVWASAILGERIPGRCTGIDLMGRLMAYAAAEGMKVFLLGGHEGIASRAADNLRLVFPDLKIYTHHGYFHNGGEAEVVSTIRAIRPDILFVGLGVPRQEIWILEHRSRLPVKVMMGVGGSLDVLAGRLRRAPRWMQELGLEWLFRLIQEPQRLPRVLALPRFVSAVLLEKFARDGVS